MTDQNLIYPGKDLTNVFPEEGSEVINEPMITVREADNRMLLHGNKVIAGTIERCAQTIKQFAKSSAIVYRGSEPIGIAESKSGEPVVWLICEYLETAIRKKPSPRLLPGEGSSADEGE